MLLRKSLPTVFSKTLVENLNKINFHRILGKASQRLLRNKNKRNQSELSTKWQSNNNNLEVSGLEVLPPSGTYNDSIGIHELNKHSNLLCLLLFIALLSRTNGDAKQQNV